MKQKTIDLLTCDLAARARHGVKVCIDGVKDPAVLRGIVRESAFVEYSNETDSGTIQPLHEHHLVESHVRPYLYPMSILTRMWTYDNQFHFNSNFDTRLEELIFQLNECNLGRVIDKNNFRYELFGVLWFCNMNKFECVPHQAMNAVINYLDSRNIDHRGMLDLGLAIDCTDLKIY